MTLPTATAAPRQRTARVALVVHGLEKGLQLKKIAGFIAELRQPYPEIKVVSFADVRLGQPGCSLAVVTKTCFEASTDRLEWITEHSHGALSQGRRARDRVALRNLVRRSSRGREPGSLLHWLRLSPKWWTGPGEVYLVSGDTVSLELAMARAASDRALRKHLGSAAKLYAEQKLTWKVIAERLSAVCEAVATRLPPKPIVGNRVL